MRISADGVRVVAEFKDERQAICLQELAKSCGYRVGHLCDCLGYSCRYVREVFGRDMGMPPKQWLRGQCMEMAERLLRHGLRPGEVAQRLGYAFGAGFRREFRQHFAMTPQEFVRQLGGVGSMHNAGSDAKDVVADVSPKRPPM